LKNTIVFIHFGDDSPLKGQIVFMPVLRLNRSMFETESVFDSRLDPGEKLLWSGQPKQGVRLQPQDALMIPFSLMWGGFAIFWEASVLGIIHLNNRTSQPTPFFFALWGIPFVLIGLYMIVGRFFYDAALRKKTYYAVTNQRLIILKNLFTFSLASFDLESFSNLNINERSDGSGDILFGTPSPLQWMASSGWYNAQNYRIPGFYFIPNAREVFSLIRDTQSTARRA
jgi:hypothetical protein